MRTAGNYTPPPAPWFVVEIDTDEGGGEYTFFEVWDDGTGALVPKAGGRYGGTANVGIDVLSAGFTAGDYALCRSAEGNAGTTFELYAMGAGWAGAVAGDSLADLSYYRHAEASGTLGTYAPGGIITGNSTFNVSVAASTMHCVAILFPRAVTLDRLAINVGVAGAAGAKARLAVYDTEPGGSDLWPRTRVLDTGEFAVDSTGAKSQTVSASLSAGLYWLCYLANDTVSPKGTSDVFMWPIFGINDDLTQNMGLKFSYTYGAFPASFPAKDDTYLASGNFVIPFVRIA